MSGFLVLCKYVQLSTLHGNSAMTRTKITREKEKYFIITLLNKTLSNCHTPHLLVLIMNSLARCVAGWGSRGRMTMLLSRGSPGTICQWWNTLRQNAWPWGRRRGVGLKYDNIIVRSCFTSSLDFYPC